MQPPKKTNRISLTKSTTITVVSTTLDKAAALFTFVYMNTNWLLNATTFHYSFHCTWIIMDNEFDFDNVEVLDGERKHKEYHQRIPRSLAFRSVSQSSISRCIDIDPLTLPMNVKNDKAQKGER
ncbi:unnamed protein product [Heterobilharzia americana]|nr:unnamed protein product [Heterobilharzia americana]